ncbi:MAG: nucleotide exchange factor GrpE [Thermodesulfovibrionales bacterium]
MEEKEVIEKKEGELLEIAGKETGEEKPSPEVELAELKDRYLRLYAEFENYRKRVQKEKEDLIRYGNESLLYELLIVLDNLEMALKHSTDNLSEGLVKGVEITLREMQKVTEKFGLTQIEALGKSFDPSLHHAMSQVERADVEDKTVIEEFRKGYMLGDKVLRPSLVAVSKKPSETEAEINKETKEE